MLRAVLLDIGGVLETTPPTGWWERWAVELGVPQAEMWRRLGPVSEAGALGRVTEDDYAGTVARELGLGPEDVGRFLADLWTDYLGTANRQLVDWFAGLRPRWRTRIVSNSFVGAREKERERYGFEELTDTIVYSHEVGVAKPDPAIYLLACDRLGIAPEEAVFVDDVPAAVEGARAVGMRAVLFRDTAQVIADVEALLAG